MTSPPLDSCERIAGPSTPLDRLEEVLDALDYPVFVKDRQSRFVFVNRAFSTLTGHPREALLGRSEDEFFPQVEVERFRHVDAELFAGEISLDRREDTLSDRSGTVHVLTLTKVPLCDAQGRVTHLVGTGFDLTHLKAQERELRVGKEELEQLVSERTEELRRAQQELLKKERLAVLGQLAAGLAHQVRNPLASITNAASVIEQRLGPAQLGEAAVALAIIKEEVLAANRIISDLLDYARVRPPRPIRVLLRELIETAFDLQALPRGIQVVLAVADELAVRVDSDQLRTALRNIVRNAIEAMPRGGTLTIAAERGADRVRIHVYDTGEGVPPDLREQIFDPLVSSKPFGLGLGLTTARALIENQGGTLRHAQREEAGAELVMELPFEASAPEHEASWR